MAMLEEDDRLEYESLMSRARDAERTAHYCWVTSMLGAAALLAWATTSQSPALMIPVIIAVACGFYATIRARQQVRLISAYTEEFLEGQATEPRWFTRLAHLRTVPGFAPLGDWVFTCLANVVVLAAIILAWLFGAEAWRSELMAGMVTGCGIGFGFHSISETLRLTRGNVAALWRQTSAGPLGQQRRVRAIGD